MPRIWACILRAIQARGVKKGGMLPAFHDLHDPGDVLAAKKLEKGLTRDMNTLCRTRMENTASVSRSLMVSTGPKVIWLPKTG